MTVDAYIRAMPKAEIHVHLEGSIRPETLLVLAQRHRVSLPVNDVDGLQKWYSFTDFTHFIEIYRKISTCLRTGDDLEWITREFLSGQAAQNIRYSEVTFSPHNQYVLNGLSFGEQFAAVNRARAWGEKELNTRIGWVIDIPRNITPEQGLLVADWAIQGMSQGVVAFGLGGPEIGNPPEKFTEAFARTRAAGLPGVPHAGETMGSDSIWGALRSLHAVRIGHGVRCLEDPALVTELRERRIPLEVAMTSNVCLKVARSLVEHPLKRLIQEGLVVTLNSDDPPMFNTTLTDEYLKAVNILGIGIVELENLVITALQVSFLDRDAKSRLESEFKEEFSSLRLETIEAEG
jgi:aminodeoxyfutalosine deaminase